MAQSRLGSQNRSVSSRPDTIKKFENEKKNFEIEIL